MSYRFTDMCCHFGLPPFTDDESASIQRAAEVGVQSIIVPATQTANFLRILALAESYPPLFAAFGLHPIVTEQHSDDCLDQLRQEPDKHSQKLVVLGEIGLDLYRGDPQFDKQERALEAQLKLAKWCELLVILYSRRAHDKLAMHLKCHTLPQTGVVHGFPRSAQQAECFMQLGYKIGVGGTITYPCVSKTREAIAQLPLESLLLEIDASDIPLSGSQGQLNRPEQIVRVFDILCELRPGPVDVIVDALYRNTTALSDMWLDGVPSLQKCVLRRPDKRNAPGIFLSDGDYILSGL